MSAAHIRPPSPAASPRLALLSPTVPGRNLKVENGTQPAPHDFHPLPLPLLDAWDEKYNRRSVPLMSRHDFEELVTSIMQDPSMSAATGSTLEAALAERLRCDTNQLETELNRIKTKVFLDVNVANEVDELLPFIQQETHHSWSQYIIQTLSVMPELYSTQQPATTQPPTIQQVSPPASNMSKRRRVSTPPSAATQPQPTDRPAQIHTPASVPLSAITRSNRTERRTARVQKTRKKEHAGPGRRSNRIRNTTRKGVQ